MSLDIIRDIKKSGSRWIMFHQHSPKFILSENRALIFDIDRERERLDDEKIKKKDAKYLKRIPITTQIEQAKARRNEEYYDDDDTFN